mgnify:CR=1 FL=1
MKAVILIIALMVSSVSFATSKVGYVDMQKAITSDQGVFDEDGEMKYSDNPQNIPEAEPTARASDPDVQPEILALKGDLEYGAYLSSECTTCHQADGDDAGIPSITGWAEEDFVVAMHAYKVKHRVHPVMQMMAGRLSDEEIAALAAYFGAIE